MLIVPDRFPSRVQQFDNPLNQLHQPLGILLNGSLLA
jgi:hypothetical protein